jgi:hypothetical protein
MQALVSGNFEIQGRFWRIDSRPDHDKIAAATLKAFYAAYATSKTVRHFLRRLA